MANLINTAKPSSPEVHMSQSNIPNSDQIMAMLNGVKDKVSDPKFLENIQKGIGPAFESVKAQLGTSWDDAQLIYHMAFDQGFDMKMETKVAALGALAYLVSPIDLLPERFLGPLGLADDVAVLMFALNYCKPEITRYQAYKAAQTPAQASKPIPPASS
jgi:uncharacterized membrane protein YkvA (DUF1232 family)